MKKLWLCILLVTSIGVQAKNEGLPGMYPTESTVETVDFNLVYKNIRKEEGYYVNHPNDLGKRTYAGITEKHNKDWLGWYYVNKHNLKWNEQVKGKDSLMVEMLVKDYYLDIWVKEGFIKLRNQEVANYLFDMRVHMFRTQTVNLINSNFGFSNDKRELGWVKPEFDYLDINVLKKARVNYYLKLIKRKPTQITFKKNWLKRAKK